MRAIWRALPRISVSASRYSSGVARPPQRELGLGRHLGERCTQLVRELGREAALVTQARGDPVEQAVEGRGESCQLVVRLAETEPPVEVVLAPRLGLLRHQLDRAERGPQQPRGGGAGDQQDRHCEDE